MPGNGSNAKPLNDLNDIKTCILIKYRIKGCAHVAHHFAQPRKYHLYISSFHLRIPCFPFHDHLHHVRTCEDFIFFKKK